MIIGIDPGRKTGVAVRESGVFTAVSTMGIVEAMRFVDSRIDSWRAKSDQEVTLAIEDARLRKWFGSADRRQARSGAGVREGVGSVKRDCSIWEEFAAELGVRFMPIRPADIQTKTTPELFAHLTGWTGRTSEHARDAAMVAFVAEKRLRINAGVTGAELAKRPL